MTKPLDLNVIKVQLGELILSNTVGQDSELAINIRDLIAEVERLRVIEETFKGICPKCKGRGTRAPTRAICTECNGTGRIAAGGE